MALSERYIELTLEGAPAGVGFFALICPNCGHTQLFSPTSLGLLSGQVRGAAP